LACIKAAQAARGSIAGPRKKKWSGFFEGIFIAAHDTRRGALLARH
jgi:hypothetical protein